MSGHNVRLHTIVEILKIDEELNPPKNAHLIWHEKSTEQRAAIIKKELNRRSDKNARDRKDSKDREGDFS